MFLIMGLGNPGKVYENTRHNIGFKAIDALADRLKIASLRLMQKCQAFIGEAEFSGHKLILAQPATFMNNSGAAAAQLLRWHKIPLDHLIVVYDDVDLPAGSLRLREKGTAGGHHGIESLIAHLHSTEFMRIRVGIGREGAEVTEYVLSKVPPSEREALEVAIQSAAEAALMIVAEGPAAAMNQFNK
ncbi:aminoacyl-tRNA hydrolase [Candidatus Saganbacteria bacterium]|nr:aminoacyl-tRNA hydrolase [Candidatus Saganbacteria bacterium]